ncbi:MAG: PhoH family protein [Bacillaceae bacterium]
MTNKVTTLDLSLENQDQLSMLLGVNDRNINILEEQLQVDIVTRGEQVKLSGTEEDVALIEHIFYELCSVINKGIAISERDILYVIQLAKEGRLESFGELFKEELLRNTKGKSIRVKTLGQQQYIESIKRNDLVFGIGPAGTGKTYLAVVMAVQALKNNKVKRIILTRPAVEAGESLGFLPGDLKEKVDPYLRPLYDGLYDVLGQEQTQRMIERGTIEIAPLAYMRGRTLDDAFVILDEAQNTTSAQMKMFLTRLGFGSKMVVNGDPTQIDLPKSVESGLIVATTILKHTKGIGTVYLQQGDVVRHPLVQKIIAAYGSIEQ